MTEKIKFEISSVDLAVLVRELNTFLPRYVSQIYRGVDDSYIIRLTGREDVRDLKVVPGRVLFLAQGVFKTHAELDAFAASLRKALKGLMLQSIEQVSGERIVKLRFEKGDTRYVLVAELFPKGGLSLLDAEGLVVVSTNLQAGRAYSQPVARTTVESGENFFKILAGLDRGLKIGVALARELGFGPKYSGEVLARAGVEQSKMVGELGERDKEAIAESIDSIIRQISSPNPRLYRSGDAYIVYAPFPLIHLLGRGLVEESTESMNLAVRLAYESYLRRSWEAEQMQKILGQASQIEKEISEKSALVEQLRAKATELREVADLLFMRIEELKEAWNVIRVGRTVEGLVKSIDNSAGLVTLVIEGREVKLNINEPVTRQIDELYQTSKKTLKGVENLLAEIEDLRTRLSRLKEAAPTPMVAEVVELRQRGSEWYHRYRWSFTSSGFLVVLGKDASSNIRLLKRHLEPVDLVFHAEVRGSPVALLKNGVNAGEEDLRESATLCAVYSRAWREEVSKASVYWVRHDQISFSPPPGIYLPKGSFIVKPPKNYIEVNLELCVGYSRRLGPIAGSEAWVSREAELYVVIAPGREEASTVARTLTKIAEEQLSLPTNQLKPQQFEALIPYGKCRILRWSQIK